MDGLHVSTNITYIRVHVDRPVELNVRRLSENENQLPMAEHQVLSGISRRRQWRTSVVHSV